MLKKLLLCAIPALFLLAACDDDEGVNSGKYSLAMTLSSTSVVSGQTLTATVASADGSTSNASPITLTFTAINGITGGDGSSFFSTFPSTATFDPSVGSVAVDFVVGEVSSDISVRISVSADGWTINNSTKTIYLSDGYTITLALSDGTTTLTEGTTFSIVATTSVAPDEAVTVTVNADNASYVDGLPATITIASGATSGTSDELTVVDDGGTYNDDITVTFTGTSSSGTYSVIPLEVTRVDTDSYYDPDLMDETSLYDDPDAAFYSTDTQANYEKLSIYKDTDVLMTRYDVSTGTDGDPHPNATLAAEGWTLLNACEFHPIDGWAYCRSAENSYGIHPVAVANGWGAQSTQSVEVRSFVDNTKYTNVTDDGYLRMWSCLDEGTASSYSETRYCGTSAIYANKMNGGYVCNNTYIGEGTRVEIRARMRGELVGFLPALWLQGNASSLEWPQYGEIDVMENHPYENDDESWNLMYQTLHWGYTTSGESPTHANPSVENSVADATEWNIYWVEILADGTVSMGINGTTTRTFSDADNPTNHTYEWPFTNAFNSSGFHILVTQGAAWNASSMSESDLKAGKYGTSTFQAMTYEESITSDNAPRIEIDWIRYWKNDDYVVSSSATFAATSRMY